MLALKAALGIVYTVAIFGALLFFPAGTLAWPRAWLFLGFIAVATVLSVVCIARSNLGLIYERMKPPIQKGQPLADRVVLSLFVAAYFGQVVFIPLDVFRFHLLGGPGPAGAACGFVLFFAGWWLVYRAQRENAFASAAVRHQAERGQRVVDTGPYAVVRHPMYAGVIPLAVGMPLALGS